MLLQESAPLVIQERSIGLQVVFDSLIGLLVPLLQLNHLAKEVQPEQSRLAPLPGKNNFAAILTLDVLADVGFKDFVGNAEFLRAAEEFLLMEIVAVGTVQVADGSDGFDHRVVGTTGAGRRGPL